MTCRVMMVDDNDIDLLFTRLILQRSGVGYDILGFERAAQALDHLRNTPDHGVSIILLDINMPVMNGFEFLEAFEALSPAQRGGAVVVMLSSAGDPADRVRRVRTTRRAMLQPTTRAACATTTTRAPRQLARTPRRTVMRPTWTVAVLVRTNAG